MSILGMATVRILTGRSASIEWLASAVTSTCLEIRQGLRLSKQVLTISASWSRSPMTETERKALTGDQAALEQLAKGYSLSE